MNASLQTTLSDYLAAREVELSPCDPDDPRHPQPELQAPEGWIVLPRDVFPHAHTVLVAPEHVADDWVPNAVLLHCALSKWRPTDELLEVAAREARELPAWRETLRDTSDFRGHRSVIIQGSYRVDDVEYTAVTRYLVIDHEYDRYLTQLTATARSDSAESLIAHLHAIHEGLRIR
ncbi:LpqN/LpqT family lipoprotein [Rhodococcus pyridinivorans]|uniref:LpqN/LpqT family lipoprotein n=1 Tax=Rhodococcus pyridinivorans TaxID=103816 RepID=UPI002078FDB1|nr:LpqN/LpqT family lipoprotein [Rhodococcus pyridinivorans]USI89879.1 LpqN/LpqT family lipoprotein [Rhodococcus pyridinivorans]